jgi:hypothetical protein
MQRIRSLSEPLRDAVMNDDAAAARYACDAIAQWGADRNSRVGAMAFLNGLKDELPAYLRRARAALRLAAPATDSNFSMLPRMNSTLCKIHSLLSPDALPIYESRVAVAAATLVELWRRDTGREKSPLPEALSFPGVGAQVHRRVRHVFADAADPGVLGYVASSESATAARWADAAVRLGLLIEATLLRCDPELFVASPSSSAARTLLGRKAAFIGSLFMAGYDPQCLNQGALRAEQQKFSSQEN